MSKRRGLFWGTRPRVYSTKIQSPEEGRIFVWAWTEWFERQEGASGAVAFVPVADSEEELRSWLSQQGEQQLEELDDEHGAIVRQEFLNQVNLYPEAPELSDEKPFQEQSPGQDIEHPVGATYRR